MRAIPQYTDSDIDEDMKLTRSDYIQILNHYRSSGSRSPRRETASYVGISTKTVKDRAHRILAEKLCRCIKPSPTTSTRKKRGSAADESRRIAYCAKSIINRKNLRQHGFRCKSLRGDKSRLRPRFISELTKSAPELVLHH